MTCIITWWNLNDKKIQKFTGMYSVLLNWITFQIKIFLTETGQETYLVLIVSSYLNKCNVLLLYTYSNSYC